MVHLRSPEAQKRREQRRAARTYIITMSYNDFLIGEKVCRTDPEEVQSFLGVTFGFCDQSAVPSVFKGVVITDGYGTGAFQQS